jgi:ATP-dependent DNA helicase RecG
LNSRQIAQFLGKKDHKKILRNHLTPMVAEGTLAYTIPEMANHPDQRYTAPPTSPTPAIP